MFNYKTEGFSKFDQYILANKKIAELWKYWDQSSNGR